MVFRTLRESETEKWVEHCMEIFKFNDKDYFCRNYRDDPYRRESDAYVAMDGDIIAASVRLLRRKMYIAGQEMETGGIAEVSTKEAYRGKGLATTLLKMAIQDMERDGMPLSLLFSGANSLYASMGWSTVTQRYKKIFIPSMDSQGYTFKPLTLDQLDGVKEIYRKFSPKITGTLVRDDVYFEKWVKPRFQQGGTLEMDGRLCAYYFYDPKAPENLQEYGETEDNLLLPLLSQGKQEGMLPPQIIIPALLGDALEGQASESYSTMVRLNLPYCHGNREIDNMNRLKSLCYDIFFWNIDRF